MVAADNDDSVEILREQVGNGIRHALAQVRAALAVECELASPAPWEVSRRGPSPVDGFGDARRQREDNAESTQQASAMQRERLTGRERRDQTRLDCPQPRTLSEDNNALAWLAHKDKKAPSEAGSP